MGEGRLFRQVGPGLQVRVDPRIDAPEDLQDHLVPEDPRTVALLRLARNGGRRLLRFAADFTKRPGGNAEDFPRLAPEAPPVTDRVQQEQARSLVLQRVEENMLL